MRVNKKSTKSMMSNARGRAELTSLGNDEK